MLQFFLNGGVPMFGVLAFSLAALVAAIRFTLLPEGRRVGAIVCLSVCALLSTVLGFVSDVLAVLQHAPEMAKEGELPQFLLQGLAESLSPLILGFALLIGVWLVMAVGYRRLALRAV